MLWSSTEGSESRSVRFCAGRCSVGCLRTGARYDECWSSKSDNAISIWLGLEGSGLQVCDYLSWCRRLGLMDLRLSHSARVASRQQARSRVSSEKPTVAMAPFTAAVFLHERAKSPVIVVQWSPHRLDPDGDGSVYRIRRTAGRPVDCYGRDVLAENDKHSQDGDPPNRHGKYLFVRQTTAVCRPARPRPSYGRPIGLEQPTSPSQPVDSASP